MLLFKEGVTAVGLRGFFGGLTFHFSSSLSSVSWWPIPIAAIFCKAILMAFSANIPVKSKRQQNQNYTRICVGSKKEPALPAQGL